jgi:hypothetical protein
MLLSAFTELYIYASNWTDSAFDLAKTDSVLKGYGVEIESIQQYPAYLVATSRALLETSPWCILVCVIGSPI